ncbi:capsular polysaccharide biosynthesis protein [Halomonas caseinilytica]|uniref:capsular polysaccharide biosynthesis protein n=1 Tax=Halomonas caseinilytica TaxID=438744 RepID=UPI0007E55ED4|nr:capsular polysaccharide biosynthesis protein [Halomonas caseinilytica]
MYWSKAPGGKRAVALAERAKLPLLRLEEGFLCAYGEQDVFPSLSLTVDDLGTHDDARHPSRLESILNAKRSPLDGIEAEVDAAMRFLISERLSRYNDAPDLDESILRGDDHERVLVIDQDWTGDGKAPGMEASGFRRMLAAALSEHPAATIYAYRPQEAYLRHESILTGLIDEPEKERVVTLGEKVNPWSLLESMNRVYTVGAHLGFEALMAGLPVSVFGMPWYAGWGATDDRLPCVRRTSTRGVRELFAAAYLRYSRYLDPETLGPGDIFDVMRWLARQRQVEGRIQGRRVMVGFRRWKAANLGARLSLLPTRLGRVPNARKAERLGLTSDDALVLWGRDTPAKVSSLAFRTGARLLHVEDGFVRSVGLGSDMVPPRSIVLDERGIYFDPGQASDLEHLLNTHCFTDDELDRAERVRSWIVEHRITKYNLEPHRVPDWDTQGREVILVPGQVEDDASIRYGATAVCTNLGLLEAARKAHPDAFLVYKPHPDVARGGRKGHVALSRAFELADHVETDLSVISCIEACDTLHTMTSLTGFDALLRDKRVVTYGEPFYAGWGLTDDRVVGARALLRRSRHLRLPELVAGALLLYPLYWDPVLNGYTSCEAVLRRIIQERDALMAQNGLMYQRLGYCRRQWLKLNIIYRSFIREKRFSR